MEKFIIVLFVLVVVSYKMYSNYMKEVDQAKKRNIQQKKDYTLEREIPHSVTIEKEALNRASMVEEISATKERSASILAKEDKAENVESLTKQSFDLREAVIYATLLERPYK